MEGETSWVSHLFHDIQRVVPTFESLPDLIDEENRENTGISLDCILPDELLERILAYLPIVTVFRMGSVCKRWKEIVDEKKFSWGLSDSLSQKPWYFMFTSSDEPIGYAYDPVYRKWYGIDLPCIETSNWFVSSSYGLVCFMDNDSRSRLYVCNPITKQFKSLEEPPNMKFSDYSALAITVDKKTLNYTVAIVKSKQVPGNFFQWDLSIQIYDSETTLWMTYFTSVICDGILYFLIYATGGGMASLENRHRLIMYNLSNRFSLDSLMRTSIPVPCSLTCGRLMNLKDKLVMVGGIGKQDRSDIIKGIGIWTLNGKEWLEITRMPHKFFQGFGEFDDVFASSGTSDIIYIQSYGAPALLMFDMNRKHWRWSQKCPVTKRFPLQLFTGFCFEPRLEVVP
ncbi:hypothetical protein AQUCO_01300215v1 [Aquilegia coerulea]|uniref:F-box domain-containing protein n=1 Tax=Aquilegia coerulea TaxID=218851 RepID=A0A2G5E0B2_AQUCA|nr:hypothetical protein AQUCO_01300215v1 [Aquilegia coerulea]